MDLFRHRPATELLSQRTDNEAFALAIPGEEYALYFPGEGEVFVNAEPGEYEARWIRLRAGDWLPERAVSLPGLVRTPDKDQWAVILKRADR